MEWHLMNKLAMAVLEDGKHKYTGAAGLNDSQSVAG